MNKPHNLILKTFLVFGLALASIVGAAEGEHNEETMLLLQASNQTEANKIADNIYSATGFGNTFLITTEEGVVIIDTSMARSASAHKALLSKVDSRDPAYIIITHGHGDHIGGLSSWKKPSTKVVMQEEAIEFLHYQDRLKGFFQRRNAAQFGLDISKIESSNFKVGNYDADIPVNQTFDDEYSFRLGELSFEVLATPSETYDALSVWIPERETVFVGDLFYRAFPNLYTLRGTKPRWALDYVNSINKVLALNPGILVPSHGDPIVGKSEIQTALKQYRDAIIYLHDAVVAGMNAGKSVDALVAEIEMPEELKIPEVYGQVDWSIRGIYMGYAGWFDGNPSTMLGISSGSSVGELVKLAGGVDAVTDRANELYTQGKFDLALSLVDSVLEGDSSNKIANSIKASILSNKLQATKNFNAAGWLKYGINQSKQASEKSADQE